MKKPLNSPWPVIAPPTTIVDPSFNAIAELIEIKRRELAAFVEPTESIDFRLRLRAANAPRGATSRDQPRAGLVAFDNSNKPRSFREATIEPPPAIVAELMRRLFKTT